MKIWELIEGLERWDWRDGSPFKNIHSSCRWPSSVPSLSINPQLDTTPVPGKPMPLGLCGHLHTCGVCNFTHGHIYAQKCRLTVLTVSWTFGEDCHYNCFCDEGAKAWTLHSRNWNKNAETERERGTVEVFCQCWEFEDNDHREATK